MNAEAKPLKTRQGLRCYALSLVTLEKMKCRCRNSSYRGTISSLKSFPHEEFREFFEELDATTFGQSLLARPDMTHKQLMTKKAGRQ